MNLCSDSHEEVCFEGRDCPACALNVTIGQLENQVRELEQTIESRDEEIAALSDDLAEKEAQ